MQNPQQGMEQMFGSNPVFQQARKMAEGKSPEQMKETVLNLAKTQGVDIQQIMGMLNQCNLSQTQNIINAVRPFPQPAYITCSPYTSVNGFGCGNGCGIV